MFNNPNRPNFVPRAVATGAFIALLGGAQADLKFLATVNNSGGGPGLPVAGTYEVDFKPDHARIVEPGGRIRLINFITSQVFTLDPAQRTYFTEALHRFLEPDSGFGTTVRYVKDDAAAPAEIFETSASKFFINTLATPNGPVAPGGGLRRSPLRPGAGAGGNSVSGVTWLANASSVRADLSSVAPLVWIGVPRVYAAAITDDLNQNESLPLSFSFSQGNSGTAFLTMQVTDVKTVALDPTIYEIPNGYRQVPVRK